MSMYLTSFVSFSFYLGFLVRFSLLAPALLAVLYRYALYAQLITGPNAIQAATRFLILTVIGIKITEQRCQL